MNLLKIGKFGCFLQSQEVIYNKRGIGYFVSPNAKSIIVKVRKELFLNNEIDYFFNQVRSLGITGEELLEMYKNYCNNHK